MQRDPALGVLQRLRQVLAQYARAELSAYAVFPSRKFLSAKVRTFVDFLAEKFGPEPYWDAWSAGTEHARREPQRRRTSAAGAARKR